MGIYYIVVCDEKEEYMKPPCIKWPEGDPIFCRSVILCLKCNWPSSRVVCDVGYEYHDIIEKYTNVTEKWKNFILDDDKE